MAGFSTQYRLLEESEPYEKGKAKVSSWTIAGENHQEIGLLLVKIK